MASRATSWFSVSRVCSIAATALGLIGSAAAHGDTYSSLVSFQSSLGPTYFLETFPGADNQFLANQTGSGNGFGYTATTNNGSTIYRYGPAGIGASYSNEVTRINITGIPTTAFAGTFRAFAVPSAQPASDTIIVQTNTGESFSVPVTTSGTFFGFTAAIPFTVVTFTAGNTGTTLEFIDDMYLGVWASPAGPGDHCSDAPLVYGAGPITYAYTTLGATADNVPGSCVTQFYDSGPDIWVRYVAPASGVVTASTCGCTYDSILRVFDACPGTGTQIACNDDACLDAASVNRASRVTFRVVAGEDYMIRIGGYNNQSGSGNLAITIVPDCRADFNHDAATNVSDIFDYLNAWFAGCP